MECQSGPFSGCSWRIRDCSRNLQWGDYTSRHNHRPGPLFKKEYDKAIIDYNKAIQLHPDYAAAYYNLGEAYSEKNEYEKAIVNYSKYINDAQRTRWL